MQRLSGSLQNSRWKCILWRGKPPPVCDRFGLRLAPRTPPPQRSPPPPLRGHPATPRGNIHLYLNQLHDAFPEIDLKLVCLNQIVSRFIISHKFRLLHTVHLSKNNAWYILLLLSIYLFGVMDKCHQRS